MLTPQTLQKHCRDAIGPARVEKLSDRVYLAIGYDLANTIALETDHGRVIVDTMMSPERAAEAKAALDRVVPGPTHAVIFTHSHIDHVGGASVWLEPGTQVWATEAFPEHFLKQYGLFQQAERLRGARQFGRDVDLRSMPCSALGRKPDFELSVGGGFRMPTKLFSGQTSLEIDGLPLELVEAHGETDDQLFVWLPSERALLPGDNYYQAFPNLYTLRGTRARPVARWIASLDAMRRKQPELLVPSHTVAVRGAGEVQRRLTDYRDAIAFVYDAVVDGANRGVSIDELADTIKLPAHLASKPYLLPLYGEVSWSVRAIYDNELGWFDGRTETLYPLPATELARREIAMMGGPEQLLTTARKAAAGGDPAFALHLLGKLDAARPAGAKPDPALAELRTQAERSLAERTANSNGRGYLLQSALERAHPELLERPPGRVQGLVEALPLRTFFAAMPPRLAVEETLEVHESVVIAVRDENARFTITIRHGVCEVIEGEPLPGTPAPLATLHTDAATWRSIALGQSSPLAAVAAGKLSIEGDALAVPGFFAHFRKGI